MATIPPMDTWPTPEASWGDVDDGSGTSQLPEGDDLLSEDGPTVWAGVSGGEPADHALPTDQGAADTVGESSEAFEVDVEPVDVEPAEALADSEIAADPEIAEDPENAEDPVEFDASELDAIEAELIDVEVALDRLSDGSYGTCETCSRPIAQDQLRQNPAARRCAEHLPLPAA